MIDSKTAAAAELVHIIMTEHGQSSAQLCERLGLSDRQLKRRISDARELGADLRAFRGIIAADGGYGWVCCNKHKIRQRVASIRDVSDWDSFVDPSTASPYEVTEWDEVPADSAASAGESPEVHRDVVVTAPGVASADFVAALRDAGIETQFAVPANLHGAVALTAQVLSDYSPMQRQFARDTFNRWLDSEIAQG